MYHLYTIDNYGDVHDHKGTWKDANTLVLQHDGVVQGKPLVEVITFVYKNENEYALSATATLDGEKIQTFHADCKRTSGKPST